MECTADPPAEALQLAAALVQDYRQAGLLLATAESCTGGLLAGAVTSIPGSSRVLERGFVVYSNESKQELLQVSPALISAHGAVSAEVAQAMADGALAASRADCAVAITGIAGPGGSLWKPEGLVYIAVVRKGSAPKISKLELGPQGRFAVRAKSVIKALKMLSELVHATH